MRMVSEDEISFFRDAKGRAGYRMELDGCLQVEVPGEKVVATISNIYEANNFFA